MNLPNKLTVFRIILVPVIVFFILFEGLKNHYLYSLLIFLIASYTDRLDGYIARKNGIITNFGKIMDPLADKILVASVFICFSSVGLVPTWVTVQSYIGLFEYSSNLYFIIVIQNLLIWISAILSLISGVIYIAKNHKYIKIN